MTQNAQLENVYHPYIVTVSAYEGKIGYFTKKETNKFKYYSKKYETYDEAIAILAKEKEKDQDKIEIDSNEKK